MMYTHFPTGNVPQNSEIADFAGQLDHQDDNTKQRKPSKFPPIHPRR